MSSGPENRYIASIHRLLPDAVYREKMHNPYRGGTFDVWYSGQIADIWIEYKWVNKLPKNGILVPELSELQKKWGRGRSKEGRHVYVVVGSPIGGVIFIAPDAWEAGIGECSKLLLDKKQVASFIVAHTSGESIDVSSRASGRRRSGKRIRIQDTDRRVSGVRAGEV